MISFQRILFPVDFSNQCRSIAPTVAAMAMKFRSRIEVLHVLNPELRLYPIPAAATSHALERNRAEREARTKALEGFAAEFQGSVPVEPVLLQGDDAAQVIACYAKENAIDLIMMPTHGYGVVRKLLLGSVTTKVLHDAACPVWTAAPGGETPPRVTHQWRRLLCAVDESARDAALLKWAAQFALEQQADLLVVHAVAPVPTRPGFESGMCDILFDVARRNLEQLQAEAGTALNIRLRLGPVGHVVREVAMQEQVELVLTGRGAFQPRFGSMFSHAYAVIQEAPCPVISL